MHCRFDSQTAWLTTLILILCTLALASTSEAKEIVTEIWCPDLNHDGWVTFVDVALLLESRGDCPSPPVDPDDPCPADFNGNGVVGRLDLVRLMGNWGPCRCKGDLNGDGLRDQEDVDILDQAILDGLDCRSDIDHSGTVGPTDVELEFVSWTSEPDSDPKSDVNDLEGLDAGDLQEVVLAFAESRDCRAEVTGDGLVNALDRIVVVALANSEPECPHPTPCP